MEHTDFALAFQDGATISDAQGALATMRVLALGDLVAPTGRIIACDPLTALEPTAFAQHVAPGSYPVFASVAALVNGDQRVACVMLRLREATVTRWEMARMEGQESVTLDEGEFFGYAVDAGVGCFMDARAAVALDARYESDESYDEALINAMEASRANGWEHANVTLDNASGVNLIMVESGWGDGVYASYWGYDAHDAPVCVVTDFSVL